MPKQKLAETDPYYAEHVSRVLTRWYAGETTSAIAKAEGSKQSAIESVVTTYADPDRVRTGGAEWLLQTRKIVVMAAAGFSRPEIARVFGVTPASVDARLAAVRPDVDDAANRWRADSLDAGFATREFRVWQLNQDLMYLEEYIPEVAFIKSGRGYEREELKNADGTPRLVPRKFEKDMYGRPVWALYRSKLLDEMAKLKGDHSATLHLGWGDQTQKVLGMLNAAHTKVLEAPVEDAQFVATEVERA